MNILAMTDYFLSTNALGNKIAISFRLWAPCNLEIREVVYTFICYPTRQYSTPHVLYHEKGWSY